MKNPIRMLVAALLLSALPGLAQLGTQWERYQPDEKLHLNGEDKAMTFDWKAYQSNCAPKPCADYTYDSATETETFRLLDNRTNRSEVRLLNEYKTGTRQFEGYATFFPPLDDECMMQVWGSSSGATQLMVRAYADNGGSIRAQGNLLATHCYGKETRINVIHLQEDSGNRFRVYLDGELKLEFADNEKVFNYHKYGCYGSLHTSQAVVKWRLVRHFQGGVPPSGNTAVVGETVGGGHAFARPALWIAPMRGETPGAQLRSLTGRAILYMTEGNPSPKIVIR